MLAPAPQANLCELLEILTFAVLAPYKCPFALQGMRSDFQALDRVHGAYKAASLAFPAEGASIKEMSPEAAPAALEAESEAADHAQVSLAHTQSFLLQHAEASHIFCQGGCTIYRPSWHCFYSWEKHIVSVSCWSLSWRSPLQLASPCSSYKAVFSKRD